MKRDMELVRAILFCFEQSEKDRIDPKAIQVEGYTSEEVRFHIELMKEGGLLHHEIATPTTASGEPFRTRIDLGLRPTMQGYDFLDSVRDPEVWRRTKEGAAKVGGVGVEFLWELGKAYTKQVIKERLGFEL